MRVIIAGSRDLIDPYRGIEHAVFQSGFTITEIVSGGARGVDTSAEEYAQAEGIPIIVIKADWDKYGKSAGYKRNVEMANISDALIAVWDGESKGTKHMIDIAKSRDLKVFVFQPEE